MTEEKSGIARDFFGFEKRMTTRSRLYSTSMHCLACCSDFGICTTSQPPTGKKQRFNKHCPERPQESRIQKKKQGPLLSSHLTAFDAIKFNGWKPVAIPATHLRSWRSTLLNRAHVPPEPPFLAASTPRGTSCQFSAASVPRGID